MIVLNLLRKGCHWGIRAEDNGEQILRVMDNSKEIALVDRESVAAMLQLGHAFVLPQVEWSQPAPLGDSLTYCDGGLTIYRCDAVTRNGKLWLIPESEFSIQQKLLVFLADRFDDKLDGDWQTSGAETKVQKVSDWVYVLFVSSPGQVTVNLSSWPRARGLKGLFGHRVRQSRRDSIVSIDRNGELCLSSLV